MASGEVNSAVGFALSSGMKPSWRAMNRARNPEMSFWGSKQCTGRSTAVARARACKKPAGWLTTNKVGPSAPLSAASSKRIFRRVSANHHRSSQRKIPWLPKFRAPFSMGKFNLFGAQSVGGDEAPVTWALHRFPNPAQFRPRESWYRTVHRLSDISGLRRLLTGAGSREPR